tara:strand:+ start:247 stop:678 length:432 start_codon:yes stop_codon:yes gene_type:complete
MHKALLIFLLALNIVSCTLLETKEDVISELEVLVDSIDPTNSDLTPELIDAFDAEFLELTENRIPVYQSEMSLEDRKKVNQLIGKYEAIKVKIYANQMKEEVKDALQQGAAMAKELMSDSAEVEEALQKTEGFLRELSEELKK